MSTTQIISRKEAKAAGLLRYFKGIPCQRGHLAERYVSSKSCVDCETFRNPIRNARAMEKAKAARLARSPVPPSPKSIARSIGAETYEGTPCRREGHTERYTQTGACKGCMLADGARLYWADPERWRLAAKANYDPDKARVHNSAYYARTAEKQRATSAQYRADHPEQVAATNAAWQAAHKKEQQEYRLANKERFRKRRRASNRRRKNRERGATGSHTVEDVAEIRKMQKDRCANPACRKPLKGGGTEDHIIAIVNGGSDNRRNIQLLCGPCNSKKHAKDPVVFAQQMGFLI